MVTCKAVSLCSMTTTYDLGRWLPIHCQKLGGHIVLSLTEWQLLSRVNVTCHYIVGVQHRNINQKEEKLLRTLHWFFNTLGATLLWVTFVHQSHVLGVIHHHFRLQNGLLRAELFFPVSTISPLRMVDWSLVVVLGSDKLSCLLFLGETTLFSSLLSLLASLVVAKSCINFPFSSTILHDKVSLSCRNWQRAGLVFQLSLYVIWPLPIYCAIIFLMIDLTYLEDHL